jgi:hypothetical protein
MKLKIEYSLLTTEFKNYSMKNIVWVAVNLNRKIESNYSIALSIIYKN